MGSFTPDLNSIAQSAGVQPQQAATPMPQLSSQLASATAITSAPVAGSVDDLEQRAHQSLLADVQARAAQINPTPPGQLSPNNPFAQQIQQLSASLQATAPDPTPRRGVKGLLSNFFQGAGSAMMHEAGLQTPYEKRQQALQDYAHYNQLAGLWENNQQEMAYRQALMGQVDDNRRFQSQMQPLELQGRQLQNQSLAYNIDQQQNTVHPSMTAGDLQSLGLSPNLSGQFAGQPLSSQDMQSLLQMSSLAGQNQKVFDYGKDGQGANAGIWLVDRQYNPIKQLSPISETGRSTALAKAQIAAMGKLAATGYAFDPTTQQTVLTSGSEAQQKGFIAFRPVKEGDIRKDTLDTKVLNDVATKSNNVIKASRAALEQKRHFTERLMLCVQSEKRDQTLQTFRELNTAREKIPISIFDGFTRSAELTKNGTNDVRKKRKPIFKRKSGGTAHLGGSATVEVG